MPAAIRIRVDAAAYQVLATRFEATCDADTRLRYQLVLRAADGLPAPQIAPLVRRSVATVQRVLRRYRQQGSDGVPPRPRPGRAPTAPDAWRTALARVVDLDPHTVGVPSAPWSLRLLASYLEQVPGHHAGLTQVWRALQGLAFVCKRPVHSVKHKAQSPPAWPRKA